MIRVPRHSTDRTCIVLGGMGVARLSRPCAAHGANGAGQLDFDPKPGYRTPVAVPSSKALAMTTCEE